MARLVGMPKAQQRRSDLAKRQCWQFFRGGHCQIAVGRALGADGTGCPHLLRLLSATGCTDLLSFEDQVTVFLSTEGKPGHLARQHLIKKMHHAGLHGNSYQNRTPT